jgi:hypothetical protein
MEYKHLLELMQDTGHFVKDEASLPASSSYSYRKLPFTPEQIIGMYLHSSLSQRPRPHFYTDGTNIYAPHDGEQTVPLGQLLKTWQEDILRENEVLQSIGAKPGNDWRYERVGDHYRVADFKGLFANGTQQPDYTDFMKRIAEGAPYQTIKQDERFRIKRRVARNRDHIKKLIEALKQDEAPLPSYAARLERSLAQYLSLEPAKNV